MTQAPGVVDKDVARDIRLVELPHHFSDLAEGGDVAHLEAAGAALGRQPPT